MLHLQAIPHFLVADLSVQFDNLRVALAPTGATGVRQHMLVVDIGLTREQKLKRVHHIEYGGLTRAIETRQQGEILKLQLKVDQAAEVVDIETRDHAVTSDKRVSISCSSRLISPSISGSGRGGS